MLTLNVIRDGVTESGKSLPVGLCVEYLGHIPGGLCRIQRPDGSVEVAHPAHFAELA